MADRFPLILNTSTNQIQEIPSGDNLDLTGTGINNAGIITAGNVTIGAATTDLVVNGDARITGILTIGTSSLKLDGPNNLVNVGTALTLGHTQGLQFHTQNLHSAGFEVNQINVSGASTMGDDVTFTGDSYNVLWDKTQNQLEFSDNAKASFGTDNDTSIVHSGTNTIMNVNGNYFFQGNTFYVQNQAGTKNYIRVYPTTTGAVELYHDNTKRFETTTSGVTVTGDGTFTGNVSVGGTLTYEDVTNIDSVGIITARAGINLTGGDITLGDSVGPHKLKFGAGADFQLFHNGSNNYIDVAGNGHLYIRPKANFYIQDYTNGEVWIDGTLNGGVKLYNNGIKKFETDGNGITVQGNINMATDSTLLLGVGADFKLFHNGTTNFIRSANGNIQIDDNSGVVNAKFIPGGASELYHNGAKKFETSSAGGTLTGNLTVNGNVFCVNLEPTNNIGPLADNKKIIIGNNSDLQLFHDGNNQINYANGNLIIKQGSHTNAQALQFDGNGHLYVPDNEMIYFGGGADLKLLHDGTNSRIDNNTGVLYIRNNTGTYNGNPIQIQALATENSIVCNPNGAVKLYYDNNNVKLETTSDGISITGTATATSGVFIPDDNTLRFGNTSGSPDLKIEHVTSGTFNRLHATNGYMQYRASAHFFNDEASSINFIRLENNRVDLRFNGNSKLTTETSGVNITGQAVATGNSAKFQAVESGGATVEIRCGGNEGYIGTQTGHKVSFITSGNRTMTLLANKELCIGLKGTTGNTSPTSTIGWTMSDGWTKGVFSGNVGGNTPWTLYNEHSSYNRYMAYVRFDGGVMSHQSNDGDLCDERIKQDFGTVSSQWNNIKNIDLKTFRYTNEPSDAKLKIGVIAQQVETIYPDLVEEDWPIGDANPNTHEKNTGDFYKSVKKDQLLMYTLKTLQEAQARIETLEAEVAALKGS